MTGTFHVLKQDEMEEDMISAILKLGAESGTWKESDIDYYTTQLVNPDNINVIYQDENGAVLAHIMARPHNEAVEDYIEADPLIEQSDVPTFYVDHLCADKSVSGKSVGIKLIMEMFAEANRRGAFFFSNHCRTINGLSQLIQKKFSSGIKVIRRIRAYEDCNYEPFDYIILEYRNKNVP